MMFFALSGAGVGVGVCCFVVGVGMLVGCVTVGVVKGTGVAELVVAGEGIIVVGHAPRQ
jgi:hypothetical protein